MTNKQLAVTLSRILERLEHHGHNDMGCLPFRCALQFHNAVDAVRSVHFWIANIAEENEELDR
jgi:hypothetical protein